MPNVEAILNNQNPMFSIVVPVYNVESYLRYCLDSVLAQDCTDYEIILVNDGSTDNSKKICEEYIRDNPGKAITLINQENTGLLLARRAGIAVAKGSYIMHLDSDDALRKDALSTIANVLSSFQCDMLLFEYSQSPSFEPIRPNCPFDTADGSIRLCKKREIIEAYCGSRLNSMCSKVVKREKACAEMNYSEYAGLLVAEDQLQVLDLINACDTYVYVKVPLYWYRQTISTSITANMHDGYYDELNRVKSRQLAYAKNWEIVYSCEGLCELLLQGLLKSCFYSARRQLSWKNKKRVFDAIRSMPLFDEALVTLHLLRRDLALFYEFIRRGLDIPAFILCKTSLGINHKRIQLARLRGLSSRKHKENAMK